MTSVITASSSSSVNSSSSKSSSRKSASKKRKAETQETADARADAALVSSADAGAGHVPIKKNRWSSRSKKRKAMRCWPEPRYVVANRTNSDVVRVFVDGACSGNEHKRVEERIGGFGAWCEQTEWRHSGRLCAPCTNNRGELQAVVHVLNKAIQDAIDESPPCPEMTVGDPGSELRIMGDNQYVLNIATDWLSGWRARGYLKADGEPPENLDLVMELDRLLSKFAEIGRPLSFQWISAHSVEPLDKESDLWKMWKGNDHADRLAVEGEQKELVVKTDG